MSPKMKFEFRKGNSRLQFLTDFIAATHTDAPQIAEMLQISKNSVYSWFSEKTDDVRLSQAMEIIDKRGYVLNISLFRPGDSETPLVTDLKKLIDSSCGKAKLKRMSFLFVTLDRYNVSIKELTKAINVTYTTFRYWCCNDDLMISRIYQIADILGLSIIFDIKRKAGTRLPEEEGLQNKERKCTMRIHIDNEYRLEN